MSVSLILQLERCCYLPQHAVRKAAYKVGRSCRDDKNSSSTASMGKSRVHRNRFGGGGGVPQDRLVLRCSALLWHRVRRRPRSLLTGAAPLSYASSRLAGTSTSGVMSSQPSANSLRIKDGGAGSAEALDKAKAHGRSGQHVRRAGAPSAPSRRPRRPRRPRHPRQPCLSPSHPPRPPPSA